MARECLISNGWSGARQLLTTVCMRPEIECRMDSFRSAGLTGVTAGGHVVRLIHAAHSALYAIGQLILTVA